MKLTFHSIRVHKKIALTISRGSQSSSQSWIIKILFDGLEGIGESAEFSIPGCEEDESAIADDLSKSVELLRHYSPWQRTTIEQALKNAGIGTASRAGIDMALFDWLGKVTDISVHRILGLEPRSNAPTSVTIGISQPEAAQQRLIQWLNVGVIRAVKVKLGSPDGIVADQAMFAAVHQVLSPGMSVSVDANGAWGFDDAVAMCRHLADLGVDHIEQPVAPERIDLLRRLCELKIIPIIADESCRTSSDVPRLVGAVDGVNIKLMKCGGISEALRMIACARSHGMRVMLGCYSQTALANTATNALASLVDYVDLDSHLNLLDDPFDGCRFDDGYLINRDLPGLGVTHA